MPLISVIVPVYNVEPYICRCIDSILSQTFTDFELILVDDGSPDNCSTICDEYALKDDRIHVIHQENGGLSAARNAGIDWTFANSNSQWISFIDSDDWVHPRFLEYLYNAVKETGTKVSSCGIVRVDNEVYLSDIKYHVEKMAWDKFYLTDWVQGVVACNKLYEKQLFQGLRYPVGKIHEDEYLTYKLLARAVSVSVIDGRLYFYYQNPTGIIKKDFSLAKLDAIDALKQQCKFAKKNGYTEFYLNKKDDLLKKLISLFYKCQHADNLSESERIKGLRYLRGELRRIIIKEWEMVKQKKEKNRYLESAFPKMMWCYWTCVGVVGKIKKTVKRNA